MDIGKSLAVVYNSKKIRLNLKVFIRLFLTRF